MPGEPYSPRSPNATKASGVLRPWLRSSVDPQRQSPTDGAGYDWSRAAIVDPDLTFQTLTVDQLRYKLERGESLSLVEIAYLHCSDEVRMDEFARYFADAEAATAGIDGGQIQSEVTEF